MRIDDYQCIACGKIFSYKAETGKEFPDQVPCECGKENNIAERLTSIPYTETAEGQVGNGNNGYTGSFAYTSSRLTPLNVLKNAQKRSDSGL